MFQVMSLFDPMSDLHWWVNLWYMVNSLIIYLLLVPSFWNSTFNKYVRFGFMLCALR